MEHGRFDGFARDMASQSGSRRAVFRLLGATAIGGVAERLGLTGQVDARTRRKSGHSAERSRSGTVQAQGKRKSRRHKQKAKNQDPPKEVLCDLYCLDAGGKCCPDHSCADKGECCPGEWKCADGSCVAQDQCCGNEKRCGDKSCVSQDACCSDEPEPECGDCSAAACVEGTKTCVSTCQDDETCCTGACVGPCHNGCQRYGGCSSCSKPPTGTAFCEAQNRCVNSDCPEGQQYDPATCQCTTECELVCSGEFGTCDSPGCPANQACVNGRCKQACLNGPSEQVGTPCVGHDARGLITGCCPHGMLCHLNRDNRLMCCSPEICPYI